MIYITGDKHSDFSRVFDFCTKYKTTEKDLLIVLGDAGINYYANDKDNVLKNDLIKCPITLFCVHGNHEERPENLENYKVKEFHEGIVYYEEEYPNILFAKDGEVYNFNNKKVLVIGGAYSIDKDTRIRLGYNWYESEQPSDETKNKVIDVLKENNNKVDIILSHTCPFKYLPREMFLEGVDQSKVDQSTEIFLDKIEDTTTYSTWYCGHFHTDKNVDNMRFMFNDIQEF